MELQFERSVCPCLQTLTCQVQAQEQTQEVRLPDAMPDIGRVLGCWGQALVRGKEWRGDGMAVSGGVLAWMLYAPEDGSQPRCVDTWIPFQMKWDFPEARRDGTICTGVTVSSMDARCVSARKLMVRSGLQAWGEALEPVDVELYSPGTLPEDVQLLENSYPMEMPKEAGEKLLELQEEVPSDGLQAQKLCRLRALPEIREHRVMTGRLIFRGDVTVEAVFHEENGPITKQWQLPFSQFVDLDRDYGNHAVAWLLPVVTALELDQGENGDLSVKCGLAVQYVIYDRAVIRVVEDAYSPRRPVQLQQQSLCLPARLDTQQQNITIKHRLREDDSTVLDCQWLSGCPQVQQNGEEAQIRIPGQFQILSQDGSGTMQGSVGREEGAWDLPSQRDNRLRVTVRPAGKTSAERTADGTELTQELAVEAEVFTQQGIGMVSGLSLGEETEPDPGRPSLILRRKGENSLWQLAKHCGSTVEAIQNANHLTEEPMEQQMLLIPVI